MEAHWRSYSVALVMVAALSVSVAACGQTELDEQQGWEQLADGWPGTPLAVEGTGPDDVWIAGARHEGPPLLRHWDGQRWTDVAIEGPRVDLWGIQPFENQGAMVAGSGGAVYRVRDGEAAPMETPGFARQSVYDLWAESPENVYAVGASGTRDGFIWHYDGEVWSEMRMPPEIPRFDNSETAGLFGVVGTDEGTVWVVGALGTVLRKGPGEAAFERVELADDGPLYAVDARGSEVVAVGGTERGTVVTLAPERRVRTLQMGGSLQDVSLGSASGRELAVGALGRQAVVSGGRWRVRSTAAADVALLHAAWTDGEGVQWAVGGATGESGFTDGTIAYRGAASVARLQEPENDEQEETHRCPEAVVSRAEGRSVARRWIEQILAAIRLAKPAPTVHSRNLYHLSVAMFDVWAAFDRRQDGYVVDEDPGSADSEAARREAISYAAYRLLRHRYDTAQGSERTRDCLRRVMRDLGYEPGRDGTDGEAPHALGNRVAEAVLANFRDDGAGDGSYRYGYANPDLVVGEPMAHAVEPTKWQPLVVPERRTPTGRTIDATRQSYLGPNWGEVRPFAVERPSPDEPYVDPGSFPDLGDEMDQWVLEVIRKTAQLAAEDPRMMDLSPNSYGSNSLAADDGDGYDRNPATGQPYEEQPVPVSDYGRVSAEYWADGPNSETPPGHWNTIAHKAVDDPAFERKFGGDGEAVDPLTWDVHMYLLLNGAVHDAAVVAWELKRHYETARPITLIRWMAEQGQSSDPSTLSYDPHGLPLVEGLVEVITPESSRPGGRHDHLAPYIGEIAVLSWPGSPGNADGGPSSARWIRAVEWIPYQARTFVTPAFPGYVSGHSTFSRASARVLHRLTGSKFFPGGMAEFVVPAREFLNFENGPSREVRLQWATYYDASDQAGQSRIWGGIHIQPDDYHGRWAGQQIGDAVWEWAGENLGRISRN